MAQPDQLLVSKRSLVLDHTISGKYRLMILHRGP